MSYYGIRKPKNRVADVKFNFSDFTDSSAYEDERKRLYGIIPEDWLPEFYKQGYNNSIEGMAYQMISGKQFFDDIDPNNKGMLNDIMATIASFITPTDILAMSTGAKFAGKLIGKYGSDTLKIALGSTNLPKYLLAEAVEGGTKHAIANASKSALKKSLSNTTQAKLRASLGAGGFGFYSGLQNAELQVLQKRDMGHITNLADATKAFAGGFGKGAVHGAAIGAVTGGLGQLGKMAGMKATSKLSKRTQNYAAIGGDKGIEIAAFGTIPSIEDAMRGEFRLPRAEEWIHAAGVVGGLGLSRKAFSVRSDIKERYDKKVYDSMSKKERKEHKAEVLGQFWDKRSKHKIDEDLWIDPMGNEVKIKRSEYRDKETGKIKDVGEGTIDFKYTKIKDEGGIWGVEGLRKKGKNTDSPVTIDRRTFFENFRRKSEPASKKTKSKKDTEPYDEHGISSSLAAATNALKKKMRVSDKNHKEVLHKLDMDPEVGPLNQQQHRMVNDYYRRKEFINKFVKDKALDAAFKEQIADLHRDGILKERLPDSLYRMITGFRQVKNRLTHPLSKFSAERMKKADFDEFVITSDLIAQLGNAGFGKSKKGLTEEQNANLYNIMGSSEHGFGLGLKVDKKGVLVRTSDGKAVKVDVGGVDPSRLRLVFEEIYRQAEKAGIPVKGYIEGYLPSMYKADVLNKMNKDIEAIVGSVDKKMKNELMAKNPDRKADVERIVSEYLGIDLNGAKTQKGGSAAPETVEAVMHLISKLPKNSKNKILNAFNQIKDQSHAWKYNAAYNLEKSRMLDIPDSLKEKDIGKLLTRYISQYAKRRAQVENFGKDGEIMRAAHEIVAGQGRPGEANILEKAYNAFTGNIETDPNFNYAPYWKNFWANATKFQVATKIGMGFGAVVNLTQPFISTAVALGYGPMVNGMWKFKTNKAYRKSIEDSVGYNNMDILKQIFGGEYADMGFFGRFANFTTTKFGFHGVNKWNFNSASATQYEYLLKNKRIANGEGVYGQSKTMRELAKRRLAEHGLNRKSNLNLETTSKSTRKKLQKSMYEFARDSQLQKNILNDPMFFNDPRFRPFVLFKRFGYKQANWIKETLTKEWVEYKNPLPTLRLVMGGFAGGLFMNSAKQMLTYGASGEDIYNENYSVPIDIKSVVSGDTELAKSLKQVSVGDIIDTIAAAGGFGLVGDIIASEDKLRAAEFFVKPAHYADAEKIYKVVTDFWRESGEFGIDAAVRRGAVRSTKVMGAFPTRFAMRFQTKQQEESYLNFRKGVIKNRILDALIVKNKKQAMRVLSEWNKRHPEKRLTYEDIGIGEVLDRMRKKAERRREIQLDLPPS